jgi:acetyltransferase-like isoleucine patch superfamily enzyme
MKLFYYTYKTVRKLTRLLATIIDQLLTLLVFYGNGVTFKNFKTNGVPFVMVALGGKCSIGKNFSMNNGIDGNPVGCNERCQLFVDRGAELVIGDNVGISQCALISHCSIKVLNNVKLGGGTSVYTTDFHSLNAEIRASKDDMVNRKTAPVVIGNNVFIGAKSIILKGVTIGDNSIIGAGSVVAKSIPENQIWAGNPAKFIRDL